jgi:hypothetical protein
MKLVATSGEVLLLLILLAWSAVLIGCVATFKLQEMAITLIIVLVNNRLITG